MKFWFLWGFDALIALVVLYFFILGLVDGSVSSFNMGLWSVILLALAGIMGGSLLLRYAGHPVIAAVLLAMMAVPGLLTGLFFLLMILLKPRWN
jgi:hypothetical protein